VADLVGGGGVEGAVPLSVSVTGLVAYRSGGSDRRQLTWFDRMGKAIDTLGPPEADLSSPRVSPDGRWALVHRNVQGNTDIWLVDPVRMSRLTFDPGLDRFGIWSPDGSRIVFDSTRKIHRDLYVKPSNGAGGEELLLESPQGKGANAWSADGRFLMYSAVDEGSTTNWDLWALPLQGDRKPFAWLNGRFEERHGMFSPDTRWVAYNSNESGRYEVYVRPFLGADGNPVQATGGAQWQISTAGGIWARWRPDGKELYYIALDGKMMAAPIAVDGTTLNVGAPVALFQTRIVGGGTNIDLGRQYDVAPDGRFLINVAVDESTASPITLILNWAGRAEP
jgi:Tol biopolymer transport system component